jgi:hypothetical protein
MDGTMRLQPTTDEVYYEFAQAAMNYTTDLSKRKDPLLFWAFDDTMEPGKTHRYRIRLGVFNPVAGTDKLAPRDADKKNQVILWSEFSKVTDAVNIPKRLYFFAKDVQDRQKTATVEVARYLLGYWRTEDFQVRPGDAIGKEMEPKEEKPKRTDRLMAPGGRITGAPMGRGNARHGAVCAAGPYGGRWRNGHVPDAGEPGRRRDQPRGDRLQHQYGPGRSAGGQRLEHAAQPPAAGLL